MFYDYGLCGWHLRSSLEVPELLPWNGCPGDVAGGNVPDIVVREAELPEFLETATEKTRRRFIQVDPAGGIVQMSLPGQMRLRISGGREVVVQRLDDEGSWKIFFLGFALIMLAHQRQLLPLHAATVCIGDRCLALAGVSGAGKSTLSLALGQQGHLILSDDLTVLSLPPAQQASRTSSPDLARGGVTVLPSFPRLRLWEDSLRQAGLCPDGLPSIRPGINKYTLGAAGAVAGQAWQGARRPDAVITPENSGRPDAVVALEKPRRLDAVIVLERPRHASGVCLEQQPAVHGLPLLQDYISCRVTAWQAGRQAALFAACAQIASSLPVYRLVYPTDFALLPESTALIEELAAGLESAP